MSTRGVVLIIVIIALWLAANGKLIAMWDAATANMKTAQGG